MGVAYEWKYPASIYYEIRPIILELYYQVPCQWMPTRKSGGRRAVDSVNGKAVLQFPMSILWIIKATNRRF